MNVDEALAACEESVRRDDPDRYFATLFAPAEVRPLLFALYAFNHEVALTGERNREPLMGAVRQQWWREAIEAAREKRPRAHPAAIGLVEIFSRAAPRPEHFEALLNAREIDLATEPIADIGALESYCDATSSGLMRIAAEVLGAATNGSQFLRHAGIAWAMTGLLRALPYHAARRKLFLPADILASAGLSGEDMFAGRPSPALTGVLHEMSARAHTHLAAARAERPHASALLAALPAALVPLYLARIDRADFNPFRDSTDVPLFRRQLALLRARLRRRL